MRIFIKHYSTNQICKKGNNELKMLSEPLFELEKVINLHKLKLATF